MARKKAASKTRRRRNPRGGILDTVVQLGIIGGLGYGGYKGYQYLKANPNAVPNLLSGQTTASPNGTANPSAAPFTTDTGYSTSSYGSTPV